MFPGRTSRAAARDLVSKADLPTHLLRITDALEAGGILTDTIEADPEYEDELRFEADPTMVPLSQLMAMPHPIEQPPYCRLRWGLVPSERVVFAAIIITNTNNVGRVIFQLNRHADDEHWIPGFAIEGCHEGESDEDIINDLGFQLATEFSTECPEFSIDHSELDITRGPISDERAEAIVLLMTRFYFRIFFRNNPEKRKDDTR